MSVGVIDANGWYSDAVRLPSPNCEARPGSIAPSLIVVHNISLPPDEFGGNAIAELFQNRLDCDAHPYYDRLRGMRVSSHFVIRRDGVIEQYVSCDERAWHAGVSSFLGREKCNDFSIGIELEGSDGSAFEAAQYVALNAVTGAVIKRYPIDAIAGHADIAPGRKTDPGPCFDWQRMREEAGLDKGLFPFQ
jgi:N-acetyl-anhydromuramoyl-L-alanine amidase